MPLNEQAYQHLQNLILKSQFSYHKIYSKTKLAKELGISRTPFRDAIHRLAQEGYIDIIPNKGFQLHQLTKEDIYETLQIRSALESYCTFQICKDSDSPKAYKLFKELNKTMEKMNNIISSSHSIDDFCKYDFQFHTQIIKYLENEQFSSIFATLMYQINAFFFVKFPYSSIVPQSANRLPQHMSAVYLLSFEYILMAYPVTLPFLPGFFSSFQAVTLQFGSLPAFWLLLRCNLPYYTFSQLLPQSGHPRAFPDSSVFLYILD